MFVSGSLIDKDNDKIKDQCYLALLEHNKTTAPDDLWFLGAPIINDYYTVFDMSPLDEYGEDYI